MLPGSVIRARIAALDLTLVGRVEVQLHVQRAGRGCSAPGRPGGAHPPSWPVILAIRTASGRNTASPRAEREPLT